MATTTQTGVSYRHFGKIYHICSLEKIDQAGTTDLQRAQETPYLSG